MSKQQTVVGLGEILWDVFPDGPRFGGAPANFSCSTASLAPPTTEVLIVSAVGDDDLGRAALVTLRQKNVGTKYVAISDRPTGQVDVQLDSEGKASYEFASNAAWDNLRWHDELETLAANTAAVCFGSLGQRSAASRETIQRFVSSMHADAIRIFDINLRPPFYDDDVLRESLKLANVLKLNDDELPRLCQLYDCDGSELDKMRQLAQRCELNCVALTRGSAGAVLLRDGEVNESPAVATEVIDTVGAGDAFTACLALGLLDHEPLDVINRRAIRVAAYVCSQAGATPTIPNELR